MNLHGADSSRYEDEAQRSRRRVIYPRSSIEANLFRKPFKTRFASGLKIISYLVRGFDDRDSPP
ncbi:hypothetical protein WN51_01684 [Melipona quadrifasciata]|uniref:Uncharacterized protein n=1 Tax=Melipona quadrifasciata TaxID=166423 RepID=A0A0N0BE54_9HYME|nr:hypothetical protein WN51_01684 [Melipona quadrifasciata]